MKRRPSLLILVLAAAVAGVSALPALSQNLITNGDFEGGWGTPGVTCDVIEGATCCLANGWTAWNVPLEATGGSPNPGNPTWTAMPGQDCSTDAGNNYQRIIAGEKRPTGAPSYGSNARGGLVQALTTVPGTEYDLDMIVKFQTLRGTNETSNQAFWFVGFDATGQTADPLAPTVAWTPEYPIPPGGNPNPLPGGNVWNAHNFRFTATGTKTSVWFMLLVPDDGRGIFDIDNVSVTPVTQPKMQITSGPTATKVDDSTFRVEWTTDVASTSTVQYGPAAPNSDEGLSYALASTNGTELTTEHSVLLTGLVIDTTYHFRVKSTAAGYKDLYSFDDRFITPGPARPFFQNGLFEDVDDEGNHTLAPWVTYGNYGDGLVGPYPPGTGAAWYYGFTANEGSYFFGYATNYGRCDGGAYQRLWAKPGATYTANFDYRTQNWDFDVMTEPIGRASYDDIQVWVGIDPTGGVDAASPAVVWGKRWTTGYDFIAPGLVPGKWSPPATPLGEVSATAEGDRITLFIRYFNKWPWVWSIAAVDNIRLTGPAPDPIPVAGIGEMKAKGQYALVDLTSPAVVTLVPVSESGFFYIQDEDGTSGIRVKSSEPVSVGSRVKVRGVLDINADGEFELTQPVITHVSGTAEPVVRIVNNRDTGGPGYDGAAEYGAKNQGLLMKVFGKVTKVDYFNEYFLLDDGSGLDAGETDVDPGTGQPYKGIKVIRFGGMFPNPGDYVAFTGVVSSQMVEGKKMRILRGRDGQFFSDQEILAP